MPDKPPTLPDPESTDEPSTLDHIVAINMPERKVLSTLPGPALYPTVKELTDAHYGAELNGES